MQGDEATSVKVGRERGDWLLRGELGGVLLVEEVGEGRWEEQDR